MPFAVKYRGLDVTVDTLDHLDQLADRLSSNGTGQKNKEAAQPHVPNVPNTEDRTHRIRLMMAEMAGNQRQFLVLLATAGKHTDSELRQKLSLSSNKGLAGVRTGVTKALKRYSISPRMVDKNSYRSTTGEREYTYSLNPSFREEVKEILDSKSRV